ncbi:MAG: alpha/beta fold hydrolase [bacterium]|nr:alpha/beta fold hydrolase [bacterium]
MAQNPHFSDYVAPHAWCGSGPPLLLIAGLGGKGTSWRPYLQTAAKHFSVLTFDNRGAGLAPALEGPVSIRDLALDVLALMDHLGLERVPVMGRSMGGMIAQELALLAPERVSKLVLVATTGRCDAHVSAIFELWAEMAEERVPAQIRHRSSMLWCLGQQALQNEAAVQPYLKTKLGADRPDDYAFQARACASHDALDRLADLTVPSLVIAGEDDRLTPPAHALALAETIPTCGLEIIPGAGHLVYLEQPELFTHAATDFLLRDRIETGEDSGEILARRRAPICPESTKPC